MKRKCLAPDWFIVSCDLSPPEIASSPWLEVALSQIARYEVCGVESQVCLDCLAAGKSLMRGYPSGYPASHG